MQKSQPGKQKILPLDDLFLVAVLNTKNEIAPSATRINTVIAEKATFKLIIMLLETFDDDGATGMKAIRALSDRSSTTSSFFINNLRDKNLYNIEELSAIQTAVYKVTKVFVDKVNSAFQTELRTV